MTLCIWTYCWGMFSVVVSKLRRAAYFIIKLIIANKNSISTETEYSI